MNLTSAQWQIVKPMIPEENIKKSRGRPWQSSHRIINGILWVLRTGAPWHDLPDRYPPYQTCHRRFQGWVKAGIFRKILGALANDLESRGGLNLAECFIDGTFTSAKKGGLKLVKLKRAKGQKSWQSQTALVFLSPFVLKLLQPTKSNWLKQLYQIHLQEKSQNS